jgi:hypothetical protein
MENGAARCCQQRWVELRFSQISHGTEAPPNKGRPSSLILCRLFPLSVFLSCLVRVLEKGCLRNGATDSTCVMPMSISFCNKLCSMAMFLCSAQEYIELGEVLIKEHYVLSVPHIVLKQE